MNFSLKPPGEQIAEVMTRIYRGGMTTASGGNISLREENGNIWTTPGGIDKGSLTPEDIVCIKADGSVQGKHDYGPTSELPSHQAVYREREDLNAIIHAHPPALVSFSMARKVPETKVIPQANTICGKVGYAPYRISGSEALGESISKEFGKGYNSVIMENHATVVGGSNLLEAFQRFETLEFCARTIIKANEIGKCKTLSEDQIKAFQHRENELPEMEEVSRPAGERQIRSDICRFVKRACSQRLMISTYGTVSVRWQKNDFLITPTDIDRPNISPQDIVQVKSGQREPGKIPSRSIRLHQAIYESHPHIHCIIITQPPNVLAFCVSGKSIDTRTSPESYVLLRDIPVISFGSQLKEGREVIEALSKQTPMVLIQNDAILATGGSILEAFDRIEVAEFSARSLIKTIPLGETIPIDDQDIDKLRRKFLS